MNELERRLAALPDHVDDEALRKVGRFERRKVTKKVRRSRIAKKMKGALAPKEENKDG